MRRTLAFIGVFALMISMLALPVSATETNGLGDSTYTEEWDGRGSDSERCYEPSEDDPRFPVYDETGGWIHWIFSTKGQSLDARLYIEVGVDEEGDPLYDVYEPGAPLNADVWHFYTPYYDGVEDESLVAFIELFGGNRGPGGGLVISDFCPGDKVIEADVTLSGTKFIDGITPPDDELAGWEIEIFYVTPVDTDFLFEKAATTPDPVVTDEEGEWSATVGPFAVGTELDLAVCEVMRDGWYQVSPTLPENGVGIIVNPDEGRVCHRVSVIAGTDATVLDLDFENALQLAVSKTAVTSYTRTHDWDIDKKVETENEEFVNGTPKIWLSIDGEGNETATWTVDVTYLGFVDSGHKVTGDITIENESGTDAEITAIVDTLEWSPEDLSSENSTPIEVDCGENFALPYTLEGGETLTCTYGYTFPEGTGQATGTNTVRVESAVTQTASAPLSWDDPDPELYDEVTITDTNAGFGLKYDPDDEGVVLKAEDYDADHVETFTYEQDFAWAGYGQDGCGSDTIDNTATIMELEKDATAQLKINIQCYLWESAWAKGMGEGVTAHAFCDNGFSNWGWSNLIGQPYSGSWPLYAGAGQCDVSKGTLVGNFVVNYNGGFGYEFVPAAGILFEDAAVYAGKDMFPTSPGRNGGPTTAPGQYSVADPLSGEIYVIAHVNAGIPDPDFGP